MTFYTMMATDEFKKFNKYPDTFRLKAGTWANMIFYQLYPLQITAKLMGIDGLIYFSTG